MYLWVIVNREEQGRRCTYKVTQRRVCAIIVVVASNNITCGFIWSLRYPEYKTHAPHFYP
jgi:hypothetical protein